MESIHQAPRAGVCLPPVLLHGSTPSFGADLVPLIGRNRQSEITLGSKQVDFTLG